MGSRSPALGAQPSAAEDVLIFIGVQSVEKFNVFKPGVCQLHVWFLKVVSLWTSVCVHVCVCVCVC